MRTVHNHNLRYHIEKELCTSFQDLSLTDCGRQQKKRDLKLKFFSSLNY